MPMYPYLGTSIYDIEDSVYRTRQDRTGQDRTGERTGQEQRTNNREQGKGDRRQDKTKQATGQRAEDRG